jgi:hypothetical protein
MKSLLPINFHFLKQPISNPNDFHTGISILQHGKELIKSGESDEKTYLPISML